MTCEHHGNWDSDFHEVCPRCLTLPSIIQLLTDPENQPHQFVGDSMGLHKELSAQYAPLPPAQAEGVVEDRWFDGGVELNLYQAQQLVEFFGGEDAEVTIKLLRPDQDEDSMGGVYCWCSDYPEEGAVRLAAAPDEEK
jgi:hypothetical protein